MNGVHGLERIFIGTVSIKINNSMVLYFLKVTGE
jgi:hypothetical protein